MGILTGFQNTHLLLQILMVFLSSYGHSSLM